MSINWYPGHMAKTRRLMLDDLKNVDLVCEIIDARIPKSSRNPDLDRIAEGKKRMLVLNRDDQADPEATAMWLEYYKSMGYAVISTNSQRGNFLSDFTRAVDDCCADILQRNADKGVNRTIKIMIAGIPNVGKSSFINRLLGKKSAIAEDRPGVTRKKQWFSLNARYDFMDTPGMLWPRIEDDEVGFRLAFTGTIRDEILDLELLACKLILALSKSYTENVVKRYGITEINAESPYDTLGEMARKRGFLLGRGAIDTERMAKVFLDEFRSGMLGRITLEMPVIK
ncbi:MAG: ribosome biogenesis GTPase YlqF [Clostridiaceae bacterium]|nr:ribosome biogenesis GTPase YlqF [Clostridiaceae bacterium]